MRDIPEGRLNGKVVTSWRISGVIGSLVFGLFIFLVALLISHTISTVVAVVIVLAFAIAFIGVIPAIRYARFRFAVDDEEVDIMHGIIVYKRTIIPLVRVQHVDTRQGPILRSLHLASVSIATAAGAHEIPGLTVEDADALRDKVAALARVAQEDV